MFVNINRYDLIVRYGLGAVLTVLSVVTLQIPMWFAFIATYPLFTAFHVMRLS